MKANKKYIDVFLLYLYQYWQTNCFLGKIYQLIKQKGWILFCVPRGFFINFPKDIIILMSHCDSNLPDRLSLLVPRYLELSMPWFNSNEEKNNNIFRSLRVSFLPNLKIKATIFWKFQTLPNMVHNTITVS